MPETFQSAGRLVALVVTYNRLPKLKDTVARLLSSPPEHLDRLVVVDNASNDGTVEWLKSVDDPRLDIVLNSKNVGGAGGFERGMRHIHDTAKADWVAVMDDDGRPDEGALAAFHASDLSEWDAVAAAVYYPDGRICEMNRPSSNPFWHRDVFVRTARKGRGGFHLADTAYTADAPTEIDAASFVGLFMRGDMFDKYGFPDPTLFLYGDDTLYTLEAKSKGARIGFLPNVRFTHDCETFSGYGQAIRPVWKTYFYHRNLMFLYRKAAGPLLFWPMLLAILPKWLLKIRHHKGERVLFLRLLGKALKDGLTRRTTTTLDGLLTDYPAARSQP